MPNPVRYLDELIRRVGDAADVGVIRAYHGSPYDFDHFDASKIGAGEGEQAYGHGLYFAGAENAAKHYRTVQTPELTLGQERELTAVMQRMRELKGLTQAVPRTDPRAAAMIDEWARLRSRRAFLENPPGHMYEVELGVPEEALLDYDAPISRQPKVVQKLYGNFAMDRMGDGGRIYRDIATRHGEAFDDDVTGVLANREASRELLAEGIPGLRYLDQRSRNAGQGTRNYVMFPGTEDSIRILRKYGILAPIAAASQNDE